MIAFSLTLCLLALAPVDDAWNPWGRVAPTNGGWDDFFGATAVLNDSLAYIGVPGDDIGGKGDCGSVQVYLTRGDTGRHVESIGAPFPESGSYFGGRLALEGDTLAVSAEGRDVFGIDSGAVHILRRGKDTWIEEAMLTPEEGHPGELFGFAIDLEKDVLVATSPGYDIGGPRPGFACIFERKDGEWVRAATIYEDPEQESVFGFKAAIMDGRIFISAIGSLHRGSVSVIERRDGSWVRTARICPDDITPHDAFGESVVASDGRLYVGAIGDPEGKFSGSVHVFELHDGVWIRTARLVATDSAEQHIFGASLAAHENTLLVGSRRRRCGWQNTIHVYMLQEDKWVFTHLLTSWHPSWDAYGPSLAFDGQTIVAGDEADRVNGIGAGSVFLFSTEAPAPCPGDLNHDGGLDLFDILTFMSLERRGECDADLNDDDRLDLFDLLILMNYFAAGCPE